MTSAMHFIAAVMTMLLVFLVAFPSQSSGGSLLIAADAAYCNMQSNETGPPNYFPIIEETPRLLRHAPNGALYQVGDALNVSTGGAYSYVLHLYGNDAYAWGFATGTLLAAESAAVLNAAWAYFAEQIIEAIEDPLNKYKIPQAIIDLIAEVGLEAALDVQFAEAQPFMDPRLHQEMQGLADGAKLSVGLVARIHMIGELTRGRCSFFGAWGDATANGHTLQLRSLDWDTSAGLQNYPVIVVYHPSATPPATTTSAPIPAPYTSIGSQWVNVAWAGWVGVLSAVSENRVAIGEIGISYPDYPPAPAWGDESSVGVPFVFMMRNVVQRTGGVAEAEAYITSANRTCHLLLCVGDGNANTARAVQYSHSEVRFYDDTNLEPLAPWHPRIPSVVYEGMDWRCPFYQAALGRQLQYYHGSLTPELSIRNVTSNVMTGDLHAAVFDLTAMELYFSNYSPDLGNQSTGVMPANPEDRKAYNRPWFRLSLTDLFGTAHPSSSSSAAQKTW